MHAFSYFVMTILNLFIIKVHIKRIVFLAGSASLVPTDLMSWCTLGETVICKTQSLKTVKQIITKCEEDRGKLCTKPPDNFLHFENFNSSSKSVSNIP